MAVLHPFVHVLYVRYELSQMAPVEYKYVLKHQSIHCGCGHSSGQFCVVVVRMNWTSCSLAILNTRYVRFGSVTSGSLQHSCRFHGNRKSSGCLANLILRLDSSIKMYRLGQQLTVSRKLGSIFRYADVDCFISTFLIPLPAALGSKSFTDPVAKLRRWDLSAVKSRLN